VYHTVALFTRSHVVHVPSHFPAFCSIMVILLRSPDSTIATCQYGFFGVLSKNIIDHGLGIQSGVFSSLIHSVLEKGDQVSHQLYALPEKVHIGLWISNANFRARSTH